VERASVLVVGAFLAATQQWRDGLG
jgi:hypothetical protein